MLFNSKIMDSSRKERERLFKQREIMQAAMKQFAENGFEYTTMDHVAEAAEFGKGTIYNYFGSKEEIYIAIIEEIFEAYYNSIKRIDKVSDSLEDFFSNLTRDLFEFCLDNKYALFILVRIRAQDFYSHIIGKSDKVEALHQKVTDIIHARIKAAVKNNEIRDFEPRALFNVYRSMIFPYIYHEMTCKEEEIDPVKGTELINSILFHGILKKN